MRVGTSWDKLGQVGMSWDKLGQVGTSWVVRHVKTKEDIFYKIEQNPKEYCYKITLTKFQSFGKSMDCDI